MIAFNFQDSHYLHSFEHCVENVRKFYPNELIDFYIDSNSDRIAEYTRICERFHIEMNIREHHQGYINRHDAPEINIPKVLESHYRIYNTCKKTDADWILLLEDDVLLKREIKRWPNADCGTNREMPTGFLGGGSIFRKSVYIRAYEFLGEAGLKEIIRTDGDCAWAGDVLKKHMLIGTGASYEKWIELAEPNYMDNTDHAVFHGYKELHKLG